MILAAVGYVNLSSIGHRCLSAALSDSGCHEITANPVLFFSSARIVTR
jgi:hypothetical protein